MAVIDCSPSMGSGSIERAVDAVQQLVDEVGTEHLRLVAFDARAQEIALRKGVARVEELVGSGDPAPGSAVAEALALAASLAPDDGHGRVHLFSDGRETTGDMTAAAARIGRRGLELVVHELGASAPEPVLLVGMRSPEAAAVGEAVTLVATIESEGSTEVTVEVTDGEGKLVATRDVSLRTGMQQVSFEVRPERSGLQRYTSALAGHDGEQTATVHVNRSVIGVVETAPGTPAAELLRALLGRQAEVISIPPSDLGAGIGDADILVLADTPLTEVPIAARRNLRNLRIWVENGGGLLVSGGRNSFGPGGYSGSELAALLPLRFPQKKEVRDPSTSLAVIIDTSGSMGGEGVSLAQEVARLALKRLKPHDKAGIVEFHGAKRWAAPMQPAANSIAIQRALNRLSAGGGTVMLPAIEEAYYGLLNVRTRTKHVLVLTDGGVEEGAFEDLLRRMADDGIHVSTVLVGPRSGSSFLARLASWGRGQFYTAPSRFQLPEVIVKQPSSSLLDPFVESETALEPVLTSRLTSDLTFDDAPVLRGYVKTEAKDTAELLLQSSLGDPVLARWHYGLGRVAVLTTQLGGSWAEEFLNWSSAPDLMANLMRQLAAGQPRRPVELTLNRTSAGIDVDIRSRAPVPGLAASLLGVVISDGKGKRIASRMVAPVRAHVWSTRFELPLSGDFLVEVMEPAGEDVLAAGGVFVPPATEFTRLAPDRSKLAEVAETARKLAAGASIAGTPRRTRELWPLCAALSLVCFILMILVRRLPVKSRARTKPQRVNA